MPSTTLPGRVDDFPCFQDQPIIEKYYLCQAVFLVLEVRKRFDFKNWRWERHAAENVNKMLPKLFLNVSQQLIYRISWEN